MKKKLLLVMVCFASLAWAGEKFKTQAFRARQGALHACIEKLKAENPLIKQKAISAELIVRFKLAPDSRSKVLSVLYDAEALVRDFGDHGDMIAHQAFYLAAAFEELSVGA